MPRRNEQNEEGGLGYEIAADFNVNDEFKPDPLIPSGIYHANVTSVKFNPEEQTIDWTFTLVDNGGVMNDGVTPIDGATLVYRNYLPKPGDENELTRDGRRTKRQAKINMLYEFQKAMGIDMSTPQKIAEALQNGDWIGLSVDIRVRIREFEGRVFNDIDRVVRT